MERDWSGESRTYQSDLPAAQGIGELAADRALARAGAVKPKTGTYPVLFDERVASSLIGHLLSAINGTSIARGSSWLRDAVGQQVLPKGLAHPGQPPVRCRRTAHPTPRHRRGWHPDRLDA